MLQKVNSALSSLEEENQVRILYACESGSRAWGFASTDSDYDVRFIYHHPKPWYLAVDLEKKRDVIELPIDDELDVSGWDLRKALGLLRRSNPPLLEWLGSPITYQEKGPVANQMREYANTYHSHVACGYHYLHMARKNAQEFLRGPEVRRKKYFYVLRPLLAVQWIEADLGLVPTEFATLLDTVLDDAPLRSAIDQLLEEKASGKEMDRGPRVEFINDFLESELARLEGSVFSRKPPRPPVEPLNEIFRSALEAFP